MTGVDSYPAHPPWICGKERDTCSILHVKEPVLCKINHFYAQSSAIKMYLHIWNEKLKNSYLLHTWAPKTFPFFPVNFQLESSLICFQWSHTHFWGPILIKFFYLDCMETSFVAKALFSSFSTGGFKFFICTIFAHI